MENIPRVNLNLGKIGTGKTHRKQKRKAATLRLLIGALTSMFVLRHQSSSSPFGQGTKQMHPEFCILV